MIAVVSHVGIFVLSRLLTLWAGFALDIAVIFWIIFWIRVLAGWTFHAGKAVYRELTSNTCLALGLAR